MRPFDRVDWCAPIVFMSGTKYWVFDIDNIARSIIQVESSIKEEMLQGLVWRAGQRVSLLGCGAF